MGSARIAGFAALVAWAPGCGDARSTGEHVVIRSPDYALPGETLEEWVSYGDQLSVISVRDATEPEPWPAYRNSGGLAGRKVTVRVGRPLWRRDGAPTPGRTLRFDVWGWMWEDDQDPESPRRPIVSEAAPRLEVGRRYLAVLVRSRGEWFPLRDTAVMTLSRDGIVTADVIAGEPTAPARDLRGKTVAEAGAVLAATPPNPRAARHFDLPPLARYRAAQP